MNILKWHTEFSRDLRLKHNSNSTVKTYSHAVLKFLEHFKNEKEPKSIPTNDIKDYLLTFKTFNTRKQALCSISKFYNITVGMPSKIKRIPYPKKVKSLPKVIDIKVLTNKISNVENLKHKTALSLGVSCGLRVSEVHNLKMCDIDRDRMILHIRNSKGQKDRIVPLSPELLKIMEKYYKFYKPKEYLLNGQNGKLQYSTNSLEKIIKKYIDPKESFHILRHSCATAIYESGTDLATLAKFLGHTSIKTTMIYTHISNNVIQNIKTPKVS